MSQLTSGTLFGVPLVLALICALMFAARLAARRDRTADEFDGNLFAWLSGGLVAAALVVTVLLAAGMYPWDMDYHRLRPVSGTVERVSSRLLGGGSSTTQKFVVVIRGREYGCDDTRCALVQPGDVVALKCVKTWVYGGTAGEDCRFVARSPR